MAKLVNNKDKHAPVSSNLVLNTDSSCLLSGYGSLQSLFLRLCFQYEPIFKVYFGIGHNTASVFLFFYFIPETCGDLSSQPGINSHPPTLEGKVLSTEKQ